ncbi:hypothetical protein VCRA2116O26_150141 [Vibrio crassostreae]|nr:hypothetical protein VCRA2117O38_150139 [Vibrio crassostreae]CAK1786655.1 hypothetical protein VCRA2116O26_150141 [Vibrio crassostreae]
MLLGFATQHRPNGAMHIAIHLRMIMMLKRTMMLAKQFNESTHFMLHVKSRASVNWLMAIAASRCFICVIRV